MKFHEEITSVVIWAKMTKSKLIEAILKNTV